VSEALLKINKAAMFGRSWIEENLISKFEWDFCGACAWASTYIQHRLLQEGIAARVAISKFEGGHHAFVLTDQHLIDVTATQFSPYVTSYLPEVIVMERRKTREFFWENVIALLKTPNEVVEYTKRQVWPESQIPNLGYIEKTYENF
jgi:hypothetical protein